MAKKSSMYQTGTINSLLQAVYLGDTSVADLKECGDFGLGHLIILMVNSLFVMGSAIGPMPKAN